MGWHRNPSAIRNPQSAPEAPDEEDTPEWELPTFRVGEGSWPLEPHPDLSGYRCAACGSWSLVPAACCGRRSQRGAAPYYTALGESGQGSAPDFSIVMLTREHLDLTRKAVESLLRARGEHSVELVFVDCASRDGSLRYFRDLARRVPVRLIVTHPEEPFVYARNCNRGAQAASGRMLLFANNDIEAPDPHLLPKLARAMADPRVGVVGTRADHECHNPVQDATSLPAEYVWSVEPMVGFLWGTRAEVFAEIGGMDERYLDYGCDETDFEYRTILANYRLAVVDTLVHHEPHATFGPNIAPGLMRNMRRFHAKHGKRLYDRGTWGWPFVSHWYPRVSVAIACRNYGRFLPRALESALRSHLPAGCGLQVVVVDDASTDDTAAVLDRYRREFPEQVSLVRLPRSRGPSAAKNAALARCIGDYTATLDADDEFLDYKLWRCLERLDASPDADFLYHDFALVLPDGRHRVERIGRWSLRRWRAGVSLPTNTWVFRSGVVRFNESCPTAEDPEFLKRRWGELKTVYLPEVLARYHLHAGSLSSRAECRVATEQLTGNASANVDGARI